MFQHPVDEKPSLSLWQVSAGFLPFVLRLLTHPRQLLRNLDWSRPATLKRVSLYTVFWLAILVVAFDDNRVLAGVEQPLMSTFKGIMMRAHDTSWDWLQPVYSMFKLSQGEAKRLWDTLLTTGFLCYTFMASLIGLAVVARLRMWRFGLGWPHAIGTGLLGYLGAVTCIALSLVPLTELFICRECYVRLTLFVLLNLAGWTYAGYFTLGDLGERPAAWQVQLVKSLGYGLAQFALAYVVFFILIVAIIPM